MRIGSILVYVTSGVDNALGENLFKLPMLFALADNFPQARISWVPGTSGHFFLQNQLAPLVGGRIHEFITDLIVPKEPLAALRTRHQIFRRHFDLIIDTQSQLVRTLLLRRIPHGCFISRTWRYLLSDRKPPRGLSRRPPLLVDKLLGLVAAAAGRSVSVANPLPVPPAWAARARELLPSGPTYIGLAPGVGDMRSRRDWPVENFVAAARAQVDKGRTPVIVLGPGERRLDGTFREALPTAVIPDLGDTGSAAGGPTLTVALSGRLACAVANDAGAGHLLAAGGAPMVSLFGWSRPEKRAPFARALVVLRAQDYGSDDISAIPVPAVLEAIERQVSIGPAYRS